MFHFRKYIMRNFRFLLLTALFPLIFMGCKSEEDSYPPIHYGYNLAFDDELCVLQADKGNEQADAHADCALKGHGNSCWGWPEAGPCCTVR